MTTATQSPIAIVGGGIAGLAAAIHAARDGNTVTLFERANEPGGRGRSTEDHGFTLNMGPHAVYPATERELAGLGVEVHGGKPSPGGYALAAGRLKLLPAGGGSALRTRLLSPRQKLEFAKVFRELMTVDPDLWQGRPAAEWIASVTRPGRSRQLLETYVRLACYADAPELLDAGDALRNFQSAGAGVRYADRGWQSIVDGLRTVAIDAGVHIRTGQRVERVSPAYGGVTLRGPGMAPFEAGAAVLAVAPRTAAGLLEVDATAGGLAPLRNTVPAKAATLDLGLRKLPSPKRTFMLGIDTPVYIQAHSLYADLAPKDGVLVSAAMYLAPGKEPDAAVSRSILEDALDHFQPGWREERIIERFLPSLTVTEGLPTYCQPRPAEDAAGLPGIYLAGDWVGSAGMLAEASLASARTAAGLASAHARRHTGTPVPA